MREIRVAAMALCLQLIGCAALQGSPPIPCRAYSGPERIQGEVALLEAEVLRLVCQSDFGWCASPANWENRPPGCDIDLIAIEAEQVYVTFAFQTAGWSVMRSYDEDLATLILTPEAGRSYRLWGQKETWSREKSCGVVDRVSGNTVVRFVGNDDCEHSLREGRIRWLKQQTDLAADLIARERVERDLPLEKLMALYSGSPMKRWCAQNHGSHFGPEDFVQQEMQHACRELRLRNEGQEWPQAR